MYNPIPNYSCWKFKNVINYYKLFKSNLEVKIQHELELAFTKQ